METFKLQVDTHHTNELINITSHVQKFVKESHVSSGYVMLFVPHTTAAITINENTDPDVQSDMLLGLEHSFPDRGEYKHFEGNSAAHIKSSVIGVSAFVPIRDNKLVLGIWQGIYFCEFDGPKTRKLLVHIIEN